ncbi:hypothetical protein DV872_09580 [Oceanispirochaeta sp. M1]|nr:hypothetical protein DV872_09580 [Oceanispirochaeta sp. M1]
MNNCFCSIISDVTVTFALISDPREISLGIGYHFYWEFWPNGFSTYALYLSAEELQKKLNNDSVDRILNKPFTENEILKMIGELL